MFTRQEIIDICKEYTCYVTKDGSGDLSANSTTNYVRVKYSSINRACLRLSILAGHENWRTLENDKESRHLDLTDYEAEKMFQTIPDHTQDEPKDWYTIKQMFQTDSIWYADEPITPNFRNKFTWISSVKQWKTYIPPEVIGMYRFLLPYFSTKGPPMGPFAVIILQILGLPYHNIPSAPQKNTVLKIYATLAYARKDYDWETKQFRYTSGGPYNVKIEKELTQVKFTRAPNWLIIKALLET